MFRVVGATSLSALVLAHYVTDFGLQSAAMAAGKAGQMPECDLTQGDWLVAHAAINAAGVWWVTRSVPAALFEFGMHYIIDCTKARGRLEYRQDQALHMACKVLIAIMTRGDRENERDPHQPDGQRRQKRAGRPPAQSGASSRLVARGSRNH